ncbi:Transcription factor DIVARICATA, partial [Cucurbita argyrosperma subsp. argyrosperma]
MEFLSPASYLRNSNWLFQETKETQWTPEENKRFENALALYDEDTSDRWLKVAAMIPGKTIGDVVKHYQELEEDVCDIEAGLIPIRGYDNRHSFTLERVDSSHGFDGLSHFYGAGFKTGSSTTPSDHERKKGIPWTEEEHRQFLMGLKKYGKGDWRNISRNFVTTRTPTQVASHAQKYFIRQLTGGKDKRRSSIHDITTVNLPDMKSPSGDSNRPPSMATQLHQLSKMVGRAEQPFDWKCSNQGMARVLESTTTTTTNGNMLDAAQLLDHNTNHGSAIAPYYTIFEMPHYG